MTRYGVWLDVALVAFGLGLSLLVGLSLMGIIMVVGRGGDVE